MTRGITSKSREWHFVARVNCFQKSKTKNLFYMQLFSVSANTTLSEGQIQRNIQKLAFNFSGSKAGGTAASAQLKTDAAATYVSLKRVSQKLGEKTVWPRMTLDELLSSTLGIEGYATTTGTDAATTYTGDFAVEANLHANIDLMGGDYLALTVENATTGLTITVGGLATSVKDKNHLKITKTSLAANESKRIPIDRADFVVIHNAVSEVRLVGDDTATQTNASLDKWRFEKSVAIFNTSGGSISLPTHCVLPAQHVDYIDVTNGATASNVLIIRNTNY
jgi:hypothetical protein